jgi:AraC family transcriptional activator of pobA
MKPVKTYANVNKEDLLSNFSISRMEDIYERHQGLVDEPHRHKYYTVLIVRKAKGLHKIDFNSYPLSDRQVYFVSPGQVHQVIEDQKSEGFALTFSTDFLIQNSIPLAFISDLNLFQNYGQSPPILPGELAFRKINTFALEVFQLFHSNQNSKFLSIGAYLKLILIECSNLCTLDHKDRENGKSDFIRKFKTAVDEHYKEEHSSSFYAQLLSITPDHLNRIVKAKLGRTTKEYIQARITIEAKRLLYFTDLTNKEIGYELGFNQPANFSAFFKKCTKLSPSDFKKSELLD